ncbi:helix-turn-helix domain-containing protein [Paraburkholderia terrae]|uniref:HTH crp-type domain-containing protein n=1 Tax=Paraburkholderia terrae TaxID=311230 RepID=A0ABM7TZC4_9BURK|nr:hypothetical protein PTKU64_81220 [Paraburkholderia terrae]BDC45697.1 hypothetical protein PTKU15_89940 [Paraburkholderia terrae]
MLVRALLHSLSDTTAALLMQVNATLHRSPKVHWIVATAFASLPLQQTRAGHAPVSQKQVSREEIGSYLGVKLETVSRMLSRFQKNGMIRVQYRQIQILDADALRSVGEAAG